MGARLTERTFLELSGSISCAEELRQGAAGSATAPDSRQLGAHALRGSAAPPEVQQLLCQGTVLACCEPGSLHLQPSTALTAHTGLPCRAALQATTADIVCMLGRADPWGAARACLVEEPLFGVPHGRVCQPLSRSKLATQLLQLPPLLPKGGGGLRGAGQAVQQLQLHLWLPAQHAGSQIRGGPGRLGHCQPAARLSCWEEPCTFRSHSGEASCFRPSTVARPPFTVHLQAAPSLRQDAAACRWAAW